METEKPLEALGRVQMRSNIWQAQIILGVEQSMSKRNNQQDLVVYLMRRLMDSEEWMVSSKKFKLELQVDDGSQRDEPDGVDENNFSQ